MLFCYEKAIMFMYFYSSSSCTTTTPCSITKTTNLWLKSPWPCSSGLPTLSTTNTENKFSVATFSMSTFKWELMSLLRKENTYWEVSKWRNGSGSQPISKRPLWDATDNHSRMTQLTSPTVSSYSKISSEDTPTTPSRSLFPWPMLKSVCDQDKMLCFKGICYFSNSL